MKTLFFLSIYIFISLVAFAQPKKTSTADSLDIEYKKSSIRFQNKQMESDSTRLEMEKKYYSITEEELGLKKKEIDLRKEELEVKKVEANVQKGRFELEKTIYEEKEKRRKDNIELETIRKRTLFMAYPFSLIDGGLDLYIESAITKRNSVRLNIGYFQKGREENPNFNMTKIEMSINTYLSKTKPVLNDFYWNANLSYRTIDHRSKNSVLTTNGYREIEEEQRINYIAPGLNIGYHYFFFGSVVFDVSLGGEFGIITERQTDREDMPLPRVVGVNTFNNGGKIRVNFSLGVPL